jgi:hypothetical protein
LRAPKGAPHKRYQLIPAFPAIARGRAARLLRAIMKRPQAGPPSSTGNAAAERIACCRAGATNQ